MHEIPQPIVGHPREVAARKRLRAIVHDTLREAWFDYFWLLEELGLVDDYSNELAKHVTALDELLGARPGSDYPGDLRQIARGWLVPVFDADGNPVTRRHRQMYTTPEHAARIEASVAELARWLEHERTPVECLLRGADYLRGEHPELEPDEVDHVVREAAKIRREGSAP